MVNEHAEENRRDFLITATSAVGVVGVGLAAWPFIDSWSPAANVLAAATTEVDVSSIAEGQMITVPWQGKPVFILHRNAEQIALAKESDKADLPDPQNDADRVKQDEWLVVLAICTHLGCVPQPVGTSDFGGFLCPCHGSHYDTSGRIRKGPAPRNLEVPYYEFKDDSTLVIGKAVA
ncbi:ubiquinol-cytochrome c reductase iron-sulfur subunit [Magnetofaba australis]|uniref:Ubiquinol-cytochrome c reductase iron-sulfur subunit n=1 Tax=Magnetofaba australis IT-1 TaxID=1434232 RepID=A0A1Y2K865_9PROT|nr:ubiquinol-cytochrome c reductase iron-sulfur subunit [Magnetofaba australis]OSM06950.1 putative ubiquinol-cytochrome C reductase, iron-sulfur subunit [Magnetofaba australis IT-1]